MATSIIQYTSPTIPFTLNANLGGAKIYVTFLQDNVVITKNAANVSFTDSTTSFSIKLEQSETARFSMNKSVEIQVNWIYVDGTRGATEAKIFPVLKNLLDKVLSYGN